MNLFLVGIVILVIAGVVYYLMSQKKVTPGAPATPITLEPTPPMAETPEEGPEETSEM